MKRINKKINLFVIALVTLLLGVTISVSAITTAADGSNKVTDQATLTVTNVVAGDQFRAYKLLDAFYDSATNVVSYQFTPNFKTYLDSKSNNLTVDEYYKLTGGDITSGSTKTATELDQLVSGYASYIKTISVTGVDMTVSGTTATATLDAGSYLVLPTATTRVYAVMVGNLDFEANGTNWVLNNESIVAKVSDAGVEKSVSGTENKNLIDQEFTYTVVGTVPQYPTNATNKKYVIKDTMSAGIDFAAMSTFKVLDGDNELTVAADGKVTNASGNEVAVITVSGKSMTVEFNVDHVTSTKVTVKYNAKLNENAVLGDAGNKNSAALEYSNDPYGNGTYTTTPDPSDPTDPGIVDTKVYGLEVLKYSGTDETAVLAGAVFKVCSDTDCTTEVGTITTDSNGKGSIKGIPAGTYYLVETKAPTGHQLDTTPHAAKVAVEGADAGTETGYYITKVSNAKSGILPFTGGTGLLFYSLIGILIIAIGTYVAVKNQKKKMMDVQ